MAAIRVTLRVVVPKCRHQSTATAVIDEATALPFEKVPTFKTTKWPLVGQLPALANYCKKVEPEIWKRYSFAKGYKFMDRDPNQKNSFFLLLF